MEFGPLGTKTTMVPPLPVLAALMEDEKEELWCESDFEQSLFRVQNLIVWFLVGGCLPDSE